MQTFAFGGDALGDAEAEFGGDEAWRGRLEPVIEAGASLAADGDGVFKSAGGDEGDARALALEHGIGAHSGAVADYCVGRRTELAETFKNGLAGIARRGKNFQGNKLPIAQRNAISEGAAAIDGDALASDALPRAR